MRTIFKNILIVIGFLTLITVVLVSIWSLLLRIYLLSPVGSEELSRHTSPDGKIDAVFVRYNAGAMSDYVYKLYLVPSGEPATRKRKDNIVFVTDSFTSIDFIWERDRFLNIRYDRARIFSFRNNFTPFLENLDYGIEIRITPNQQHDSLLPFYH